MSNIIMKFFDFFFFQIESPTDVFYDSAEHLDLQMSAKKVELVW